MVLQHRLVVIQQRQRTLRVDVELIRLTRVRQVVDCRREQH